jgi:hypothetical protein
MPNKTSPPDFTLHAIPYSELPEPRAPCHGKMWGPWKLNARNLTLTHTKAYPSSDYEINLERMNTSGQMLDWIFQVHDKTWCSPQDMGLLIAALRELFHPQSTLCSGGGSHTLDATAHLQKLLGKPRKPKPPAV